MIRFDDPRHRFRYNRKEVDPEWNRIWTGPMQVAGRRVTKLGCGGGTYCRSLAAMGAYVTGVDASAPQLETAQAAAQGYNIDWIIADAAETGLPDGSQDVVLMRALVHHLSDPLPVICEAARILAPGGWVVIQDRTEEDCLLPFSPQHLRGHLFEHFPRLAERERKRRFSSARLMNALSQAGFFSLSHRRFWEVRHTFGSFQALQQDFLDRNNRSILHELTDDELSKMTVSLINRLKGEEVTPPIIDQDCWTLWIGQKPEN